MAFSAPVVIASDQSAIPVSGTLTTTSGTGTSTITGTVAVSGTSAVSGTVTSILSGTATVVGTVTSVPSGTQTITGTTTVVGTVTDVPSGTQTVSGTVTSVPSGTTTVAGTVTANGTTTIASGTVTVVSTATVGGSVVPIPATTGGLSIKSAFSVANVTGVNFKSSAGQLYGWVVTNTSTAPRYVKIYNKATAPSVGTDTPTIRLCIPADSGGNGAGQVAAEYTMGIAFSSGIGYGITTDGTDAGTGSPGANEVIVNFFYN